MSEPAPWLRRLALGWWCADKWRGPKEAKPQGSGSIRVSRSKL